MTLSFKNNVKYAPPIATIDLCKMGSGPFHKLRQKYPPPEEPQYYFYAPDGNTEITTDLYGANLQELPLKETIDALAAEMHGTLTPYRRLPVAYAMLNQFWKDELRWGGVVVLHYGY